MQRRLALLGDGIGHVALTGVALGFLTGTGPRAHRRGRVGRSAPWPSSWSGRAAAPAATWRSRCCSTAASRAACCSSRIAPGGSNAKLNSYLFGSISSVTTQDVWVIGGLAVAVLGVVVIFGSELFVLCQDEEVAKASGLPVRFLSLLIAVTAALTVVIAMRVVGLLLVSALMVVPVATSQQLTRGFRAHDAAGHAVRRDRRRRRAARLVLSAKVPPGAAIVLLALAGFVLALGAR